MRQPRGIGKGRVRAVLQARDYEDIIRLSAAVLAADPWRPAWQLVLATLVAGTNGSIGYLTGYDWRHGKAYVESLSLPELDPARIRSFTEQNVALGNPTGYHFVRTYDHQPVSTCRLMEQNHWRASDSGRFVRQSFGSTDLFALPLVLKDEWLRGFLLHRDSGVFADREIAYGVAVQPVLRALDAHYAVLNEWMEACRLAGRQPPTDLVTEHRLTAREIAVLTLLSQALTATAIAHRLGISVRTVHKHIENLYRKLGTRDRVETILRAQWLGVLPFSPRPDIGD